MFNGLSEKMWGKSARLSYLLLTTIFILFAFLGGHDIWTQEFRWAEIVFGMFYRNDFLHPYLGQSQYYDKPLLSYWLIVITAKLLGSFSIWALRLPSAFAGCLAIFSIYQLGCNLKNKSLGLLSGWLLLTTYYFVFWARVSSADMLNLAGTLFAISWYISKRNSTKFFDYLIFFCILALTSLCKGLIGAVVAILAVFTDVCLQKSWMKHLNIKIIISLFIAAVLYFIPFFASTYFSNDNYQQNGLYMVYRENFLRYFEPFDHKGPIYTYFIYLPIYLLPISIFLLAPALLSLKNRIKLMSKNSLWILATLMVLFLFFTFSGSRRSYYVLPMVPFAILLIADWLTDHAHNLKLARLTTKLILSSYLVLFLLIDFAPHFYYQEYGVQRFAADLKAYVTQIKPWQEWDLVLLDAETKVNFYLQLAPHVKNYDVFNEREKQTNESLAKAWPVLQENRQAIFISRKRYQDFLTPYFPNHKIIETPRNRYLSFLNDYNQKNAPIAFIPVTP